jgi:solute carrier family 25 oxoglutarate transporter 11
MLQADTTLPADQRRNYKGVGDALTRIVKDEGIAGLFTGAGPTVVRACALNMGMLASNDQVSGRGLKRCITCRHLTNQM